MITHIKIDGFKSFKNFEMSFTPLTVVSGPNASGKSNLFDALQLLSDLAQTDLKNALLNNAGRLLSYLHSMKMADTHLICHLALTC